MPTRRDSKKTQVDIPWDWMPDIERIQSAYPFPTDMSQHAAILLAIEEGLKSVRKQAWFKKG